MNEWYCAKCGKVVSKTYISGSTLQCQYHQHKYSTYPGEKSVLEDNMSSFYCDKCGALIVDTPEGYVTGCEHYPLEFQEPVDVEVSDSSTQESSIAIMQFKDEYRFLSNFYPSPFTIDWFEYPTVEHWYQAHKASTFEEFDRIRRARTPSEAKKLGRKCKLRFNWDSICDHVMFIGVYNKFIQNPDLAEQLIATGDKILIEGNYWHDNYWGKCLCKKCESLAKRNKLGNILEQVRELVRMYVS